MIKKVIIVVLMVYISSCKPVQDQESNCSEIPELVIEKDTINGEMVIVKCYLNDNSIHQFNDGIKEVNIVPLMRNETANKKLYVERVHLVGYDTLLLNSNVAEVKYTITFPNPKGGDVRLLKVIR